MTKGSAMKKAVKILLAFAVMISFGVVIYFGGMSTLKTLYPHRYSEFVEIYSKENNLSEEFIYAVIKCESNFETDAVSYVGAKGLMQIMPDTFDWIQWRLGEEFSEEKLFEAETAIRYGCYLYGYLVEKFGNEKTAIAAYHAGPACVEGWLSDERYSDDGVNLKKIPYPSTAAYVEKVMKVKDLYTKLY